jgi:hypothetical protein
MKNGRPYTYTVLRYVHDVVTGEFVNVGVILHVPSLDYLGVRVRSSIGRLREIFPDLERNSFTRAMQAIERSVDVLARRTKVDGLFKSSVDAAAMAGRVLPKDDSSLQWSTPVGAGLTDDPEKTIDRLYERFVARYDRKGIRRRTDEDVWRPVKQKLDERKLSEVLREKTITGRVDDISFKHAWKNGIWHVYEPLSFDLADADGIKTKAREWLGHLAAVADGATEAFKPHFIVGAPATPGLGKAFETALAILHRAPGEPDIVEETRVDDFVSQIESEVRAHRSD